MTLGNRERFSRVPSEKEWVQLYQLANKQSLTSFLIEGVNKVKNANVNLSLKRGLVLEWIGVGLQTEARNKLQNQRAAELCDLFKKGGFKNCILKGQGTSLYYEHSEHRQCGDIDIWVSSVSSFKFLDSKVRDEVLEFARAKGWRIGHIDIKHSDIEIFEDVPVEVHFQPSWMYCPSTNKRLMRFFAEEAEKQFGNYDKRVGFTHTTIDFDLVYSMVHIYRHIFSEGIGLRQLVDYYYILRSVKSDELRVKSFETLRLLRMEKFVAGVMWILKECFGMQDEYLLCPVNERHGKFLLSEIMTAGNFGQYDERTVRVDRNKKFERGFAQLGRNLRFVTYYPSEVLWSPFWKLWHWCWRKRKGYL